MRIKPFLQILKCSGAILKQANAIAKNIKRDDVEASNVQDICFHVCEEASVSDSVREAFECNLLIFPDDVKLCGKLNDIQGSASLDGCCDANMMQLNLLQCMVISLLRGKSLLDTNYRIHATQLKRCD
ncbi:hypothetical protein J6590_073456 [Homalodisca vitripennis]|nr:hypothetical protein J6590_073456 [Homalodisca vitripennis]